MGKWLIGCTVVFLLVVGLIVALGFVVFREAGDFADKMEEGQERLEEVTEKYTWSRPEDGILDEERVDAFLEGRVELSEWLDEKVERIENGGFLDQIRGAVSLIQEFQPEFARVLEERRMSPAEYAFHAQEIALVIQYAGRDEVLEEFPQMGDLRSDQAKSLEDGESAFQFGDDSQQGGGWGYLSSIPPDRLTVPRKNLEIVAARTEVLQQSMSVIFVEQFVVDGFSANGESLSGAGD